MQLPGIAARYLYRRAERRRKRGHASAAHRDLARAAQAGYTPAQQALAQAYQTGRGCTKSGALAKHWYCVAAEAGCADAQFELGVILLNGRDIEWMAGPSSAWLRNRANDEKALIEVLFPAAHEIESDPEKAFYWLLRAAESGKVEAQANVGWLFLKGIGCKKDRREARRWLTAASQQIGQAALGLAEYYADADASDFDLGESFQWAKKASELGNPSGSYRQGLALRDGRGTEPDLAKAESCFSLADAQGHQTAAYDCAILTLARQPPHLEALKAIERVRMCAKRGHLQSAIFLADLYRHGNLVEADFREAFRWYKAAADLGDVHAQFMVGCLYARGEGVEHDIKHAARYFETASKAGHSAAAYNLGVFCLHGQGVRQSVTEAKRWLAVAAEAHFPQAQLKLGSILHQEATTPQETEAAISLIKRASDAGNWEAMTTLAKLMMAEATTEARQRAIALLKKAGLAGEVEALRVLSGIEPPMADQEVIFQTLRRLAQDGNNRAKIVLAEALLSGERLQKDVPAAVDLLVQAANSHDAQAHFLLGVLYCQGIHIQRDVPRGYAYYVEAACLNHPLAQYNAGVMLVQGLGVEQDISEGMHWLSCAETNNVDKAKDMLTFLRNADDAGDRNGGSRRAISQPGAAESGGRVH